MTRWDEPPNFGSERSPRGGGKQHVVVKRAGSLRVASQDEGIVRVAHTASRIASGD